MTTDPKTTTDPCCAPGCCDSSSQPSAAENAEAVRDTVREGYAKIAQSGQWSSVRSDSDAPRQAGCCSGGSSEDGGGGCCGPTTLTPDQVAAAVGYAEEDLADLPDGANMGLSCGNPTAIASLQTGETLLDLGSGGGFDCFIAGPRVGPTGRVIGVDMTPDMLAKARRNTAAYRERSGLDNVEFRLGEIEHLPAADNAVDVVISNCVINLSPDKPRVWREIARVLKPGGRVAVSDLALLQPLPEAVRADVEALVGCVAGAELVEDTRRNLEAAGLTGITLRSKPEYIDSMTRWEDPLYQRILPLLPDGSRASDYITSLDIEARKP